MVLKHRSNKTVFTETARNELGADDLSVMSPPPSCIAACTCVNRASEPSCSVTCQSANPELKQSPCPTRA
jgi:hypothetical protein